MLIIIITTHARIVLDALKGVDPDRKCFRMVGGVLVERTVKEVVPALENNHEQVITNAHTSVTRWKFFIRANPVHACMYAHVDDCCDC